MAECKYRTVKHSAIYDTIRTLVKEDPNIKSLDDILAWFKSNYKTILEKDRAADDIASISEEEIVDALILPDQKNVDATKKEIQTRRNHIIQEAKAVNGLEMFMDNVNARNTGRKRGEDSPAKKQVKDVIKRFTDLAKRDDIEDSDIELLIEMIDAVPGVDKTDRATIDSVLNHLRGIQKQRQADLDSARIERLSSKLATLFKGEFKKVKKTRVPPAAEITEMNKIMQELYKLAGDNVEITAAQYADIISRLDTVRHAYIEHYDKEGIPSEIAIETAIGNLHQIRKELKIDSLNKRIAKMQEDVESIDSGDFDVSVLLDNSQIPWKPIDAEILKLEHQLQDEKERFQNRMESLRRKARADQGFRLPGNFIVRGKPAMTLVNLGSNLRQYGWELPRTLGFMADLSAFGVQLAPIIAQDVWTSVGRARIADAWINGFVNVIKSDYKAFRQANRSGDKNALYRSKGSWTRAKYAEILEDELYELMNQAGLKISQAKSLTDSEEYFKTSLVNKVPVFGLIKDISEDTMVTTLNLYRVAMFKQFYRASPGLTLEEYTKVAEHINNLTGTTKDYGKVMQGAAYVFSAPRLLVSRLKLMGKLFGTLANSQALDIPRSFREKKVLYASPADAYVARHLAGLGASYAAYFMFAAMALPAIAALFGANADFGDDWEESNFMRIQVGSTSFDITGGMGAILRTIATMYSMVHGPTKGDGIFGTGLLKKEASASAEKRINYMKETKGLDAIGASLNFFRTKLHPTISRGFSVITGKDFMGKPYAETAVGSRAEAILRGIAPIFVETTVEQLGPATPGVPWYGDIIISVMQGFGINTFQYDDMTNHIAVRDYFNELGYKPDIRYPDEYRAKEKGIEKDYLKLKYRELWGNAVGQFILDSGADPYTLDEETLKNALPTIREEVNNEFLMEFGPALDRIPDAVEEED